MFYSLYIFLMSTLHNADCVNQFLKYFLGEKATKHILFFFQAKRIVKIDEH